ncbi:hypothetical protein VB734_12230 [Synechococcus sp. BA-124 BA4]|nr:hypothetical protein [Synechococcus sp. BA-124 BA4]MEA5400807.1 hypothetical protein [Synechococcus sp. BA-124 BA4]
MASAAMRSRALSHITAVPNLRPMMASARSAPAHVQSKRRASEPLTAT